MQTDSEAALETSHWDRARFDQELKHARTNIHPEHWPADVRCVSLNGLGYLGLDRKGRLYLDGEPVYTAKRWETFERVLASIGLAAALIGAASAGISACLDWSQAGFDAPHCLPILQDPG